MIVAVAGYITGAASELGKRGHTVVKYGKYSGYVDAILYRGEVSFHQINVLTNNLSANQNGVLMINAEGKTFDDIDKILK
ncbi:MAG: YkuS family protein, partial [Clostridiales bacterium]|nr:YkuS family protein [Clostridiales bacterium]